MRNFSYTIHENTSSQPMAHINEIIIGFCPLLRFVYTVPSFLPVSGEIQDMSRYYCLYILPPDTYAVHLRSISATTTCHAHNPCPIGYGLRQRIRRISSQHQLNACGRRKSWNNPLSVLASQGNQRVFLFFYPDFPLINKNRHF